MPVISACTCLLYHSVLFYFVNVACPGPIRLVKPNETVFLFGSLIKPYMRCEAPFGEKNVNTMSLKKI